MLAFPPECASRVTICDVFIPEKQCDECAIVSVIADFTNLLR